MCIQFHYNNELKQLVMYLFFCFSQHIHGTHIDTFTQLIL